MAVEIASLVARLSFQHHGGQEAIAMTRQVEQSVAVIEQAAQSSSASLRDLADQGTAAIARLVSEQQRWAAIFAETGVSIEQLSQGGRALSASVQALGDDIAALTALQEEETQKAAAANEARLAAAEAYGKESVAAAGYAIEMQKSIGIKEAAAAQSKKLNDQLEREAAALKLLGESAPSENQLLGKYESISNRAARSLGLIPREADKATRSMFRFNATTLTALSRFARSGQVGNALIAQLALGFQRAGGAAALLAGGVGSLVAVMGALIALPVIAFFAKVTAEAFKSHDALQLVSQDALALSDRLGGLEGATRLESGQALESAVQALRNIGSTNAEGAAATIAAMADQVQHLNGVANDAVPTLQALIRLAESGDTSALEGYDLDLRRINEAVAEANRQGQGYRAGLIAIEEVQRQVSARSKEIAERAAQEGMTWADLANEVRLMVAEVAQSDEVRQAITNIIMAARDALPAIQTLAAFIGDVLPYALKGAAIAIDIFNKTLGVTFEVANLAGKAVVNFVELATFKLVNRENDAFLKWLSDSGDDAHALAKELWTSKDAWDDWEASVGRANDTLGDIKPTIDQVKESARTLFSQRQEALGFFDQLGAIGEAFRALDEDGATGYEAVQAIQAIDRALAALVQSGGANVQLLGNLISELGAFLPEEAFNELKAAFDGGVEAAGPLFEAAQKITDSISGADSVMGTTASTMEGSLNPSMAALDTLSDNAAQAVDNVRIALESLPSQVNVDIVVGLSGAGSSLLTGGVGSFNISGGSLGGAAQTLVSSGGFVNPPKRVPTIETPTSSGVKSSADRLSRSRGGTRGFREADISKSVNTAAANIEDAGNSFFNDVNKWYDRFNPKRGGGGAKKEDDRDASIEEIRAFFNQVNKAILTGIRGGRVFSLAGNAIPLGGPGQFVSSQGGTLIETVNLRGVWDFADPAAKREIIRQLREALSALGSEVA